MNVPNWFIVGYLVWSIIIAIVAYYLGLQQGSKMMQSYTNILYDHLEESR